MVDYSTISNIILNAISKSFDDKKSNHKKISVTEAIQCLRKSYFRRKIPHRIPETNMMHMMVGRAVHEYLQKCFSEFNDAEIEFEVRVEDDLISGYVDAVLKIDNEEYLLEFKTVKDVPNKPQSLHRLQLNTYLALYSSPFKSNCGFVVYIPKTSKPMRIYSVKLNLDDFAYVRRRAEILAEALHKEIIPHAEMSSSCYFCEFHEICRDLEGDTNE